MLDSDLAKLYGVETKVLNQAVKRNIRRFPADFMFQLTKRVFEVTICDLKRWQRWIEMYPGVTLHVNPSPRAGIRHIPLPPSRIWE